MIELSNENGTHIYKVGARVIHRQSCGCESVRFNDTSDGIKWVCRKHRQGAGIIYNMREVKKEYKQYIKEHLSFKFQEAQNEMLGM